MSKVTIKKGPMTIGPVSIGSMEITMDSATLEFIQSRLGIKRPELLQDLAEIVADDAIVSVHAKGARLEGGSKPKFRLVRRAQE